MRNQRTATSFDEKCYAKVDEAKAVWLNTWLDTWIPGGGALGNLAIWVSVCLGFAWFRRGRGLWVRGLSFAGGGEKGVTQSHTQAWNFFLVLLLPSA